MSAFTVGQEVTAAQLNDAIVEPLAVEGSLFGSSAAAPFSVQAGTTVISFSGGAATYGLPGTFPNGILAVVAQIISAPTSVQASLYLNTTGWTAGNVISLSATENGAAYSGNLGVSYIAIGW